MPFTDRYIQLPISLVEESDLPVAEEGIAAIAMVNPFDISFYCEAVDDTSSKKELSRTQVYLRNGECLVVEMYLYEFELLLNTIKHV